MLITSILPKQTLRLPVRQFSQPPVFSGKPNPQRQLEQQASSILFDSQLKTADKTQRLDQLFGQGWDLTQPENANILLSAVTAVGIKQSEPRMVEYLIKKGANLYAQGHLGWNAAHQVVNMPFPPYSLLTMLLKADSQQQKRLANMPDQKGFTPVHTAARKGYLGALERFKEYGADFTLKTPRNQDAYKLACLSKKQPAIDFVRNILKPAAE